MTENFIIGDTVRLKSGGPVMTVKEINNDGVECNWFSKENELKRSSFVAETIKKTKPGMNISAEAVGSISKKH